MGERRVSYEQVFWQSRVSAAFRTGWACLLAGLLMQFRQEWLAFPVFAYVTAVTVVAEGSLGEALRTTFWVLVGTVFGTFPTILFLWLITPARFSLWIATVAVLISSFVIAFPDSFSIVAKRVAFAQTSIIYISANIYEDVDAVMYPLRIAGVTALGAGCAVVAMVLPVPRLACYEAEKKSRLTARISSEVLRHLVQAFLEEDSHAAHSLRLQAESLFKAGNNILKQVEEKQVDLRWEIPFKKKQRMPRLVSMEFPELKRSLQGMDMALKSCNSKPTTKPEPLSAATIRSAIQLELIDLTKWACHALKKTGTHNSDSVSLLLRQGSDAITSLDEILHFLLQHTHVHHNLDTFFLIFNLRDLCKRLMQILQQNPSKNPHCNRCNADTPTIVTIEIDNPKPRIPLLRHLTKTKVLTSLKCSISLSLSVLFGLLYGHTRGYWAAIAVAISMSTSREATFKLANVRAQGTVAGSVYGVIATLLTQEYMLLRAVALIPWVIFTSFLRQSEMYGYAGGLSAFIAAIIILGRKDDDPPPQFAIIRITETFIGLACYILVEIALNASRASTLARAELSAGLVGVHDLANCLVSAQICPDPASCPQEIAFFIAHKHRTLESTVTQFRTFVDEAKVEPDFWFLPFPSSTYTQLLDSLSTVSDLLFFATQCHEALIQAACASDIPLQTIYDPLKQSLQCFEAHVATTFRWMGLVLQLKSLKKRLLCMHADVNSTGKDHLSICMEVSDDDEDAEEVVRGYDSRSTAEGIEEAIRRLDSSATVDVKTEVAVALAGLAFCMQKLVERSAVMERELQEVLQWENPWSVIDMREMYRLLRSQ